MRPKLTLLAALFLLQPLGCSSDSGSSTVFEVVIENIAPPQQQPTVVFAPAIGVIHRNPAPAFTIGQPAGDQGLESYAEDGAAGTLLQNLPNQEGVTLVGLADNSIPSNQPGLLPGERFRLVLSAQESDERLTLLLAFLQANDLFVATPEAGVPLFDAAGNPFSGDITGQLTLLDAGTEVNQPFGQGSDQSPQQAGPNTGAEENGVVRPEDDQFSYPSVPSMLRVTVAPLGEFDLD